jgi:Domain of unknown function (DUF4252)
MKAKVTNPSKFICAVLLGLAVAALPAFGQEPARLRLNGLEKLTAKATEVVDVNLDGSMLKLASKFINEDEKGDAELRQLLQNLKGIYVKSFEFEKEGAYTEADLDAIRSQLTAPAWSKIISVRNGKGGDNAEVYLMGWGSDVQGMAIIAAEPNELTVVNLVGPIDLDKLSSLGGHLGVPDIKIEPNRDSNPKEKTGDKKP